MAMDTHEYDGWRAGELAWDERGCGWCGAPSEAAIGAHCQERYAMETAAPAPEAPQGWSPGLQQRLAQQRARDIRKVAKRLAR